MSHDPFLDDGGEQADAAVALPLEGPPPGPQPPSMWRALVEIALCSGFPTQLLTMAAFALIGFKPVASADDWSIGYVAGLLLVDSALVVTLAFWFLHLRGERPGAVFLGTRPWPGEVVYGLLLIPIVFVMVASIGLLVQRYAPQLHQEQNPFQALIKSPYGILLVGGLGVIVGGLREEIQRAFVLHRFTQIGIPVLGLIAFSVLFGLGHAVQGWDATLMTTALGLVWGVVYLGRRSVIAPAVCHGAFDVIQVIAFGMMS